MTKNKYYEIKKCLECGKEFESLISRKQKCCCVKCSNIYVSRDKERIKKIKKTKLEKYGDENYVNPSKSKQTCLKKYGVDNPSKSEQIKDSIKKTNLQKFGKEHYFQTDEIKDRIKDKFGVENVSQLEEVKDKKKKTFNKRYGVENPFQSEEVKEKIKNQYLEKYGVEYPSQSPEIRKKIDKKYRQTFYQKLITTHKCNLKVEPLFSEDEYINTDRNNLYKFKCLKCNSVFEDHIDGGHLPRCQKCYPLNKGSICEKEIFDFIQSLLPCEEIQTNVRNVIDGELDIYIPSKKIAFEYDSFYYHRFPFVDKDYHIIKTNNCEKQCIRLIHIFEDEWINKQKLIKEKIRSILGIIQNKIFARNCIIKEISPNEKSEFLDQTHVQGNDKSSIRLGAFHNDILVGVMTFGKLRISLGSKNEKDVYELYRYSTNQLVVGLFSKMLKYFERQYNPKKIITYADRRFSWKESSVYQKCGFTLKHETEPNFWYFKNGYSKRYHRFSFRKNVLSKKLNTFDDTLTGHENMQLNGYNRIYDCGSLKFEKEVG